MNEEEALKRIIRCNNRYKIVNRILYLIYFIAIILFIWIGYKEDMLNITILFILINILMFIYFIKED